MPTTLFQSFLYRVADEFTAVQTGASFAIFWPKVQMPWLIIWQNARDGINKPFCPYIDRHGLYFDDLRQRLTCKSQARPISEMVFA